MPRTSRRACPRPARRRGGRLARRAAARRGPGRALGYGQRIDSEQPGRTDPVAAIGPDGTLVAVLGESGARVRAHVVLAPAGS
nr:hypothetical protein [Janibacter melonis]